MPAAAAKRRPQSGQGNRTPVTLPAAPKYTKPRHLSCFRVSIGRKKGNSYQLSTRKAFTAILFQLALCDPSSQLHPTQCKDHSHTTWSHYLVGNVNDFTKAQLRVCSPPRPPLATTPSRVSSRPSPRASYKSLPLNRIEHYLIGRHCSHNNCYIQVSHAATIQDIHEALNRVPRAHFSVQTLASQSRPQLGPPAKSYSY